MMDNISDMKRNNEIEFAKITCNIPQVVFLLKETEVMRIGKDIFEDVRAFVGCEYISDLTRRKAEAIKAIGSIDLKAYSDEQITAFRRYVCRK